jgi:hypothetical protein
LYAGAATCWSLLRAGRCAQTRKAKHLLQIFAAAAVLKKAAAAAPEPRADGVIHTPKYGVPEIVPRQLLPHCVRHAEPKLSDAGCASLG